MFTNVNKNELSSRKKTAGSGGRQMMNNGKALLLHFELRCRICDAVGLFFFYRPF